MGQLLDVGAGAVVVVFAPVVALTVLLSSVVVRFLLKSWLLKRIGGFTGDCLGGAQQLIELWIYLVLVGFVHNGWWIGGVWL